MEPRIGPAVPGIQIPNVPRRVGQQAPMPRQRVYASATMPAHLRAFNDINLASQIIGHLDPASRLQFKQAAKCTFNVTERVMQLYITKMERLTPAQRTVMFNTLLERRQFHALETQALIALGEGVKEIGVLRSDYAARPPSQTGMPFVHWCLDHAITRDDARPMHLALCLPETDVNAMYESGGSSFAPLHIIARTNHPPAKLTIVRECMASLLAHPRIDVNLFGGDGLVQRTPLLVAVRAKHTMLMEELIKHPALEWNLPAQPWRETALHEAARDGSSKEKLRILLTCRSRVNLNAQDAAGNTPLHVAVRSPLETGHVRLLIDAGADQTIRNNQGCNAYDEAIARKKDHLLQLFSSPGLAAPEPGSWQHVLGVGCDERRYAVVHQVYKTRIWIAHPDKGGSIEALQKVQRAWEQAQPLLEKN